MLRIECIGHIGKDATVGNYNNKSVINFNVAHSEKYKVNGVENTKTIWLECSYWVDRTAVAQYLKKGTLVYIEGQPEVRTYTNNSGETKASLTVRVFSVQLLGSKDGQQRSQSEPVHENVNTNTGSDISEPVDDLPF